MRRHDLVPDCRSCAAVCCVATSFEASEDFAFDKASGTACHHLMSDWRCAIHDELIQHGCQGCAAYDCHGAGQRVTRAFAGMYDAELLRNELFMVLRVVHELLWLLTEAREICPSSPEDLPARLSTQIDALDALAARSPRELLNLDLRPLHDAARSVLRCVGVALGGHRGAKRALVVLDARRRL